MQGVKRVYGTILFIFAAAVVMVFLFATKIRLQIKFNRAGDENHLSLAVSVWRGIVVYRLEVPPVKAGVDCVKNRRDVLKSPSFRTAPGPAFKIGAGSAGERSQQAAIKKNRGRYTGISGKTGFLLRSACFVRKYKPAIAYLLRRVELRCFQWKTEIGAGDPSRTGLLSGMAWGLKGLALNFLYRLLSPAGCRPVLAVLPAFGKTCFNTSLDCALEVRVRHIFLAGCKLLALKLTGRACN